MEHAFGQKYHTTQNLMFFQSKLQKRPQLPDWSGLEGSCLVPFQFMSVFIIHWEFRKGIHSSGILFFFWLFLVLVNIIPCRSYVSELRRQVGTTVFFDTARTLHAYTCMYLIRLFSCKHARLQKGALQVVPNSSAEARVFFLIFGLQCFQFILTFPLDPKALGLHPGQARVKTKKGASQKKHELQLLLEDNEETAPLPDIGPVSFDIVLK